MGQTHRILTNFLQGLHDTGQRPVGEHPRLALDQLLRQRLQLCRRDALTEPNQHLLGLPSRSSQQNLRLFYSQA